MEKDPENSPQKMKRRRCRYTCCHAVIISLVGALLMTYFIKHHLYATRDAPKTIHVDAEPQTVKDNMIITSNVFNNQGLREQMLKRKAEKLKISIITPRNVAASPRNDSAPCYNVHVFYYAWYGNQRHGEAFNHWNRSLLPNWKHPRDERSGNATPPQPRDIASNFYPQLGPYSCKDNRTLGVHMRQLRDAGVGVLVLSWTPPNYPDSPDAVIGAIFERAAEHRLKVALHIEPYAARHPANLRSYLRDFLARFGGHPALYKARKPFGAAELPVFYVYDSYLIPEFVWRELLGKSGKLSVRGTDLDGIFLGLLAEPSHRVHIRKARFDGFYTYFAANSFSYGSTWKNWRGLARYARQNALIFSPSVGPGYADTNVRPWNAQNTRQRHHGRYYDVAWRTALAAGAPYVSITSFNQWHEGTQIEPARSAPFRGAKLTYMDYSPEGPMLYMNLTQFWVEQYEKALKMGGASAGN